MEERITSPPSPSFLRVVVHRLRLCFILESAISNLCITVFSFFFVFFL